MKPQDTDITGAIAAIQRGEKGATDRLAGMVYDELRRIARDMMEREPAGHTLQPTALVNQAFERLLTQDLLKDPRNRAYFYSAAVRAMRQVLVDHARRKNALKRGGEQERVPLEEETVSFDGRNVGMLDLDNALGELAQVHERQHQVLELRFFGGLGVKEIAEQLAIAKSTVESDLRVARAWLRARLE